MPRRSRFTKPDPIKIGPVTARAVKRKSKDGQPFYLREDGRAYWQARERSTRTTVWTGWATPQEVETAVVRLVARGRLEASSRSAARDARTIGELLAAWMESIASRERRSDTPRGSGLSPKTVAFYDKAARHLTAWLGDVRPEQVTRQTLEAYVLDRQERDERCASIRTVEREVCILKMAWKWGIEQEVIPERRLPRFIVAVDERAHAINHHTPSWEDVQAVLSVLEGDVHLVVWLMAVTGCRVGAACRVKRQDFDLVAGTVAFDWKTGRRTFPLRTAEPALFASLAARAEGRGFGERIFDLAANPEEQVRAKLKRACRRAGVEPFTPHGLRRMVVTRLIQGGVDVATAANLMGHSPEVMLRRYAQVSEEMRRQAVADAALGGFGGGRVLQGPWPGADGEEGGAAGGGAA